MIFKTDQLNINSDTNTSLSLKTLCEFDFKFITLRIEDMVLQCA